MRKNYLIAFQISSVYVGTIVGAGFATGKEIVQFFTQYSFYGLIGVLISTYLFVTLGTKLMVISVKIKATSYKMLIDYLFGKYIGKFVNLILLIMLLGVTAVMLSGAGALFNEQLGMPKQVGILLTIILTAIVIIVGVKGVVAVNSFVVPMLILFSFILLSFSVQLDGFTEGVLKIDRDQSLLGAIISSFTYVSLNLVIAQAVLVPLAHEVKDLEVLKWGGRLGGLILGFVLIASHLTLVMLPNLNDYEIPMAVIMKSFASYLYLLYILIIYSEIFTSVIGNVYGVNEKLNSIVNLRKEVVLIVLFAVIYVVSFVNYGQLLAVLYPLFGYISLLFIGLLIIKKVT